jgi:hypothetical protein
MFLCVLFTAHEEIIGVVNQAYQILTQDGCNTHDVAHIQNYTKSNNGGSSSSSSSRMVSPIPCVWESYVWPEIKRKILAILQCTRGKVTARRRSFEFLGN